MSPQRGVWGQLRGGTKLEKMVAFLSALLCFCFASLLENKVVIYYNIYNLIYRLYIPNIYLIYNIYNYNIYDLNSHHIVDPK